MERARNASGARSMVKALLGRARESVWTLPIAKVLLAVGGLTLFALLGRSAMAEAKVDAAEAALVASPSAIPSATPASASSATFAVTSGATEALPSASAPAPISSAPQGTTALAPATPDSPVVLNAATEEDLRRLPGIGPKKASAIVALRRRLGRFHQVDDLLRVKGIGRTTLKRLRPLVRVDAPSPEVSAADAGAPG